MSKIGRVDALLHAIDREFPPRDPPDVSDAPFLGCCAEHRDDFEGYRGLTRDRWEDALRTDDHACDPIQYMSLDPRLFHYLAPAVFRAALAAAEAPRSRDGRWQLELLVGSFVPVDREQAERLRKRVVALFTDGQRAVVLAFLRWFLSALEDPPTEAAWALAEHAWASN